MDTMREFKLSSGHFWREFAFFNLVFGLVVFLLSITRYKDASFLLLAIVMLLVNLCYVVQYIIWPPLKEIAIEPATQELTYKLLWRHPVRVEFSKFTVKYRTWTTRSGSQAGLLFYIGFNLMFRAPPGPGKKNDLAEIYQLVTPTPEV